MTVPSEQPPKSPAHEISLLGLAESLWSRRRFITYSVTSVVGFSALILLLTPNMYRSHASILPSGQQAQLSDIKSLMGISALEPGIESSSELYPVVLRSRQIKDAVLLPVYQFQDKDASKQLALPEYFDEDVPELLYRALDKAMSIDVDGKTGVIRVSLETRYPDLSRKVLSQILKELEDFNRFKRHSKASDNARYLNEQLAVQIQELERAEDSLELFRLANRNWSNASNPEIVKNDQRLRRQVELKTTTVAYLTQEFESAKFEAHKDTPILRILDEPSLPSRKSGPFRTPILAAIFLLSLMVACGIAVVHKSISGMAHSRFPGALRLVQKNAARGFYNVVRLARFFPRSKSDSPGNLVHTEDTDTPTPESKTR